MQVSISVLISGCNTALGYVRNLIKSFKERVATYPNSIFEAEACLSASLKQLKNIGLLDDASLVITPNAYNEGILYDVVPNTTLGDMDVVRATTATRVNEQGLVEVVPYNLLKYSEQLNDASWIKSGSSIVANTIIAPNGTLTADTLIESNTNVIHSVAQSVVGNTVGMTITVSFYAKKKERTGVAIMEGNNLGGNSKVGFNLENGTVYSKGSLAITATISKDPLTDWCYCTMSFISVSTNSYYPMIWTTYLNQDGYLGDGISGIYLWGMQSTISTAPKTYLPTTTRLNIPRIDYTNGTCPSILVEPQSTNIYLNSSSFTGSYQGGNVITSSETSPLDGINYLKFSEDTSTGQHHFERTLTALANTTYTMSIFAKKAERDILILRAANSTFSSTYVTATFNLTTGVATNGIMIPYQNGYRCIATFTTLTDTILRIRYNIDIISNYNGISGYGLYVTGAQLEAGSYTTSYIPTVASTVTRNADVISKTGISSLIGQTEGTMFVDCYPSVSTDILNLSADGTFQTDIGIGYNAGAGTLSINFYISPTYIIQYTVAHLANTKAKIAFAYKSGDLAIYINGVQKVTYTNLFSITNQLNRIRYTQTNFYTAGLAKYNQVALFKTRLSNTELAQLTTL